MSILPPNPYPPVILPDPEVLAKYGKLAWSVLRCIREKANTKGKEHKKFLRERGYL